MSDVSDVTAYTNAPVDLSSSFRHKYALAVCVCTVGVCPRTEIRQIAASLARG
ncbi:hypothetical protein BH20CHL2_BH20CHL2_13570 [soil metagenome]